MMTREEMTREEALAWMRERFRAEHMEANPEWVETMVELLMLRPPLRPARHEKQRRSPLESVGPRA